MKTSGVDLNPFDYLAAALQGVATKVQEDIKPAENGLPQATPAEPAKPEVPISQALPRVRYPTKKARSTFSVVLPYAGAALGATALLFVALKR